MKYIITIITSFLLFFSLQAQQIEKQVISSTGNNVSAGSFKISQTVGESVVTTFTSGSFILGQGFQQVSESVDTAISIKEIDLIVDYKLFPNPTKDVVNLELVLKNSNGGVFISLFDIEGRTIESKSLKLENDEKNQTQFSLINESNGIYFLKISNAEGTLAKTLEINKF